MAHTYPNVLIHCIFSTKLRRKSIPDDLPREAVNVLCRSPSSSKVQLFMLAERAWIRFRMAGYGAISVSASNVFAVRNYIEHQTEHHAKRLFEDEFVSFLTKSGVKYDPEFVFG